MFFPLYQGLRLTRFDSLLIMVEIKHKNIYNTSAAKNTGAANQLLTYNTSAAKTTWAANQLLTYNTSVAKTTWAANQLTYFSC